MSNNDDCPIGITPKAHGICSVGTCWVCKMDRNLQHWQEVAAQGTQIEHKLRAELAEARDQQISAVNSMLKAEQDLAAERERCAKIVEAKADKLVLAFAGCVAAAIRKDEP